MDKKYARESEVTMTEMVLPNDTNIGGNLFGGKLLYWMDIVAVMAALKHSNKKTVTASVDNVSFSKGVEIGSIITLNAKVTRAFRTSMEVHIQVFADSPLLSGRFESNSAFFTMVALDDSNNPTLVPELIPETEEEKRKFKSALNRRELRLVLAKRMKPTEATNLKALFTD